MSIIRSVVFFTVVATCASLSSQERPKPRQRDPMLLDVLARVVNAAGGAQALATVRDLTESGEITFHWAEEVKGSVIIHALGTNRFRMEADLPEGKRTWAVKAGSGSVKEPEGKVRVLSYDNAINLENLTFPLAYFGAALTDSKAHISLVGIEDRDGRSIYRLRVKGQLGLSGIKAGPDLPVVKDLLVDALTFNIVSVEDRPFQTFKPGGEVSDKPSRAIEFEDFRKIDGVLVPFSITTKLMGQLTLSIHLSSVRFNSGLGDQEFEN